MSFAPFRYFTFAGAMPLLFTRLATADMRRATRYVVAFERRCRHMPLLIDMSMIRAIAF